MASLWAWLRTPPTVEQVLDPFGLLCLIIFAPGFVISAYLAGPNAETVGRNPVQREGLRRWATIGQWIFGAGLFFFGVRALQINPLTFGAPIWLVGCLVVLVAAALRCWQWWRTTYPSMLELYAERRETVPSSAAVNPHPNRHPEGTRPFAKGEGLRPPRRSHWEREAGG